VIGVLVSGEGTNLQALIDAGLPIVAVASNQAGVRYPPRWLADLYAPTGTRFSNAKAKRVLGWEPLVPLAEGQTRANAWLHAIRLLP
jgi:nucleoside-diphosphate-sugar epimerase